jgi:hypothetical protein
MLAPLRAARELAHPGLGWMLATEAGARDRPNAPRRNARKLQNSRSGPAMGSNIMLKEVPGRSFEASLSAVSRFHTSDANAM